ncbi:hypothetical protein LL273_03715 [Marinobacter salarius]|uniref:hypothetical protein n=1 Tax=Marinobacter salarius TaxID=1420917 RepID=UPI001D19355A|nr:hypothetical protein [Marinobacter salarius]MCC4282814.1 hypothetical protein [Marinobacter salarius]
MREIKSDKPMGGYQGLELPFFEANLDKANVKTNSARSALKIILKAVGALKVWLPAYTCDAVVDAVYDLGIELEYYRVSSTFDIDSYLRLGKGEYILVVDYFGLTGDAVSRSLDRFGQANTIVDCSQAYFSGYAGALATFWSPRKFFGLPDGGLLYSDAPHVKQPEGRDTTSETRLGHLISRLTNSPEVAYHQYQEAELRIAELPVQGMSHLTERLLHSVNYEVARAARNRNVRYLHDRLGKHNQLKLDLDADKAPLCYPLLPNIKTTSRSELINHRVFLPSYWPEVLTRVEEESFEWNLVTNGLFLPCDQRYTEEDMDRLLSLLAIQ